MSAKPTVISFLPPPMPYYLECGSTILPPGAQHPSRHELRMFDWIIMVSGTLYIGEEKEEWALIAGQTLLLRPDLYHYSIKPCEETTEFYWIHFTAEGAWEEHAAEEQLIGRAGMEEAGTLPVSIHIPKHWPDSLANGRRSNRWSRLSQASNTEKRSAAFWNKQKLFHDIASAHG